MDTPGLRELLERLHSELEHGPPLDDRTRELLGTVLADIQDALGKARPPSPGEPHSLIERLRETTWHLEESHPRLTSGVGELVEALTRIFR